ncbi:PREDICTED: uncharacterized protein LOC105147613 [Acromyrmex echinatior]|uniref:uncharacterized protein LOC105147613 n=1 Tax=Acromyrmex echinatior TaxID=103372 RepID=UPI000580C259|nr:PREDICTED: uncharacterized protein LOC105147613 [Acromyrmex echinatior]
MARGIATDPLGRRRATAAGRSSSSPSPSPLPSPSPSPSRNRLHRNARRSSAAHSCADRDRERGTSGILSSLSFRSASGKTHAASARVIGGFLTLVSVCPGCVQEVPTRIAAETITRRDSVDLDIGRGKYIQCCSRVDAAEIRSMLEKTYRDQ